MHPYQKSNQSFKVSKFLTLTVFIFGLVTVGLVMRGSQQTAVAAGSLTPICNYNGTLGAGNSVDPICPIFGSNTPVNFYVSINGENVYLDVTDNASTSLWSGIVEDGEEVWGTGTLTVGTNNRFTFTNSGSNSASITLLVYPIDSTPFSWSGSASGTGKNSQIELTFPSSGLYQFDFSVNGGGRYDFLLDTNYLKRTIVANGSDAFYVAAGTYLLEIDQDNASGMVDWQVDISFTGNSHDTLPYAKSGTDIVQEWIPVNLASATSVNLETTVSGGTDGDGIQVEIFSAAQWNTVGGGIDVYNDETNWSTYDLPAGTSLIRLTSLFGELIDYELSLQALPSAAYNWAGVADDAGLNSHARVIFPSAGLYTFNFAATTGRYQFLLDVDNEAYIQNTVEGADSTTFYVPAGTHDLYIDQDMIEGADWGVDISAPTSGNDSLPYTQMGGELGGSGNDFSEAWLPISLASGQYVNMNLEATGDIADTLMVEVYPAVGTTPVYTWTEIYGTENNWTNVQLSAGINRIKVIAAGNSGPMSYDLEISAVPGAGTANWSGYSLDTGLNPVIMVNFPTTGLYQFQVDSAAGFANLVLDDAMTTNMLFGTGLGTTYDVQVSAGMHEIYVLQDTNFMETDWSASVQPVSASSSFFTFTGELENGEIVIPEYTVPSGDLDFNFEFTVTGGDVDLTIQDGSSSIVWDGTGLDGETVWGTGMLNGTSEMTLSNTSGTTAMVSLTLYHIPTAAYDWDGFADYTGEQSHIRVDFPTSGLYTFDLGVDSGSYQFVVNSDFIQKTAVSNSSVAYYVPAGRHDLYIEQESTSDTNWDVSISSVGAANNSLPYTKSGSALGAADFATEWLPIKLASASQVNMDVSLTGTDGDFATVQVWDNTNTLVASENVFANETHWLTFDLDNGINRINIIADGGNAAGLDYDLTISALPTAGFSVDGVSYMNGENSNIRAIFPTSGLYTFDLGNTNGRYQLLVNSSFIQKTSEVSTTVTYYVPAGTHDLAIQHDDTVGAEWSLDVSSVGAANDTLPYTKSGGEIGGLSNVFNEEWLSIHTGEDVMVNMVITVTGDITDSLTLAVWDDASNLVTVDPVYGAEVLWQTFTLPGNGRLHIEADGGNTNPLAYELAIYPIPSTTYFLSGQSLANGLNSEVVIDLPAEGTYGVTVNSYQGFTNFLPELTAMTTHLRGANTQYYEFDAPAGHMTFTSMQSAGFPITTWDATVELIEAAPPTITAIDPISTTEGVAIAVTINGTNFMPGITAKLVDGSNEYELTNVVRVSATEITATVPDNVPIGVYDVTVTNPDAQSATLADAFTVEEEIIIIPPPPDGDYIVYMPAIFNP